MYNSIGKKCTEMINVFTKMKKVVLSLAVLFSERIRQHTHAKRPQFGANGHHTVQTQTAQQ